MTALRLSYKLIERAKREERARPLESTRIHDRYAALVVSALQKYQARYMRCEGEMGETR